MGEVDREVEGSLARAVGGYIRATSARELPRPLRRFKPLAATDKGLAPHRAELLGALDDEVVRGLLLEWLDDRPALKKDDAAVLRAALERGEAWEEELAADRPEPRPEPEPPKDARDDVERERDKTRRAREELRRAKEEARVYRRQAEARLDELRQEVEELQGRASEAEAAARVAGAQVERVAREAERDVRRARRDAERAVGDRDELKEQVREQRKELIRLRRRVTELEARLASAGETRAPGEQKDRPPPRPRRALPVPKGRLEDDPATLDAWLTAPRVHLLVDGYNVTKVEGGYGDLDLETQRERLIDALERLARKKRVAATIVFDGAEVAPGTSRRSRGRVEVEYSRPDEIADDHLIRLLQTLPPDPVVVVTNDRELRERAEALGATVAGSEQLLAVAR